VGINITFFSLTFLSLNIYTVTPPFQQYLILNTIHSLCTPLDLSFTSHTLTIYATYGPLLRVLNLDLAINSLTNRKHFVTFTKISILIPKLHLTYYLNYKNRDLQSHMHRMCDLVAKMKLLIMTR
jgi:hypothetical protein